MPGQPLKITGTDRLDDDTVVVEYSDNSIGFYSTQQLSALSQPKMTDVDIDEL
jgi:hypothetical protein